MMPHDFDTQVDGQSKGPAPSSPHEVITMRIDRNKTIINKAKRIHVYVCFRFQL